MTSAGVVPTPAIAYLTRSGYDAGIVISASHNPFEDNGIKVFSGRGEKFTESVERAVEAIVADPSWSAAAGQARAVPPGQSADAYLDHLRAVFPESSSLRDFKLAIDCANGATSLVAPGLFASLGLDTVVIGERARRTQHQPRLRIDASRGARAHRRRARLPHGRGLRRRRRPRHLRGPSRRDRQRRRRPADVRAPAAARGTAERQHDRGDRDEQHRPRDRVPRVGHQPRAVSCGRQVRDGGDDQGRRLAGRRAVGPRDLLGLPLHGRRPVHRPERAANRRAHGPYPRQPRLRSDQLPAGAAERARPRESRSSLRARRGRGDFGRRNARHRRRRAGPPADPLLGHRTAAARDARGPARGRDPRLGPGDRRRRQDSTWR